MKKFLTTAAAVSGLAVLAACSQPPGYISLPGHVAQSFPAAAKMRQARSASVSAGAYQQALYKECMEHAEYEHVQMQDYRDAMFHADNALAAAGGGTVSPTELSNWQLPADKIDELTSARSRLVAALNAGAPQSKPDLAARAVCKFNCWVEQQEENFQPRDIAYCRNAFYAALEQIEVRPVAAPAAVPETMTLDADVFFDFNRATIKPAFFPELDRIARMLVENTNIRLQISGHADRAGPAGYNQGLSERRARAVADYLAGKGVTRERVTTVGYGETRPAVPTADGVREPRNRRVEIRQR